MTNAQGSLRGARLDEADARELLASERQCVLSYLDDDGWPRGVVLSYLFREGRFWVTAIAARSHAKGMRRDRRVTVTVERHDGCRQMLAQRGRALFHDDPATKREFYRRFALLHAPDTASRYRAFLDTPGRVVVEIEPVGPPTTHDSRRLPGDGRGS